MKLIDLTGQRFGRLVVIGRAESRVIRTYLPDGDFYLNTKTRWRCRCDCGKEVEVDAQAMKTGNTKSCGCLRRNRMRKMNLTEKAKG